MQFVDPVKGIWFYDVTACNLKLSITNLFPRSAFTQPPVNKGLGDEVTYDWDHDSWVFTRGTGLVKL